MYTKTPVQLSYSPARQSSFSDRQLLKLCKKFGRNALKWRQRFVSLLPEVEKRKLYLKRNCTSVFEFAAKFGGVSNEQVSRVLNLEKRLEDKPILKSLFESGEVSSNKIMRVMSIATKENEAKLADHLKLMSQKAVEVFVKDEKYTRSNLNSNSAQNSNQKSINFEDQNGLDKTKSEAKSVRAHTFEFTPKLTEKLTELEEKGFDLNKLLLELLEKREEEIETAKQGIAEELNEKARQGNEESQAMSQPQTPTQKASRYIPVKIKQILKEEYGNKCGIPNCQTRAEEIHHEHRFALLKNLQNKNPHDPRYLKPLCKAHHQITHTIDVKYNELRMRC